METEGNYTFLNSSMIIGVVFGGAVLVLMYIIKVMRNEQKITETEEKNVKNFEQFNARKDTTASTAISKKKKNIDSRWTNRTDKQGYTHPWLLTSLKGHTGQVLDMDFATNGKYLASCADEEPDPRDLTTINDTGGTSSSSECNKENSRPPSSNPSPHVVKPLSRRQRKNRRREESSSPESKKKNKAKKGVTNPPQTLVTYPMKTPQIKIIPEKISPKKPTEKTNYQKLGISDSDLNRFLRSYLLSPEQMLTMGYPIECASHPGSAIVFKSPVEVPSYPKSAYKFKTQENTSGFDVNAREFIPGLYRKQTEAISNETSGSSSSGHDSGNSTDSEESSDGVVMKKPEVIRTYQEVLLNRAPEKNLKLNSYSCGIPPNALQKTCVRCENLFYTNCDNTCLSKEPCVYHWGKVQRVLGENRNNCPMISNEYTCCRGKVGSRGCVSGKVHVWFGLMTGFNGPLENYVRTRHRTSPPIDHDYGVYALDGEMCFTRHGLELTKISIIALDGRLVYDSYVKPENEIVDYNTRFSGITEKDMQKKRLKTLKEVQSDLLKFIYSDTILIGHGLENDLRALRIIHMTVIDTAVTFPHYNGLPYRRSLKSLMSCFLKKEIQTGAHNSIEDAQACMELMLWRVRKDFRSILDHSYYFG